MIVRHNLALTHGAEFSGCMRYRYRLRRSLTGSVLERPGKPVVFLMCNPSTADSIQDDPTIRRCVGFAKAWGYSDLLVSNLYAFRASTVSALRKADDPVGPENDDVLRAIPAGVPIVAAWGAKPWARERVRRVLELVGRPLLCLRTTRDGSPEHPLYIPQGLEPKPWSPPA